MSAVNKAADGDAFLGGRLILRQHKAGYRAGSDAVLLAAAVAAKSGEAVLDVGAGAGALTLCLAARLDAVQLSGLELQDELVALARANAVENGLGERVDFHAGDLRQMPDELKSETFDHVVTNPPYFEAEAVRPPPDGSRAKARVESALGLGEWIGHCLKRVRSAGSLTLIQRPERLGEIVAALSGASGNIVIFPLWPKPGAPAGRIIVRALKSRRGALKLASGLILHDETGAYSAAAEAILRHGRPLALC